MTLIMKLIPRVQYVKYAMQKHAMAGISGKAGMVRVEMGGNLLVRCIKRNTIIYLGTFQPGLYNIALNHCIHL